MGICTSKQRTVVPVTIRPAPRPPTGSARSSPRISPCDDKSHSAHNGMTHEGGDVIGIPVPTAPDQLQDSSVDQSVDDTNLATAKQPYANEGIPVPTAPDQLQNAVTETKPENHTAEKINPTIPQNFHPELSQSQQDVDCQQTVQKLAPVESEAICRNELQQLLVHWKESGKLAEIENHALSVASTQAGSTESLAAALTNPNAKYITSLGENCFHEQVAKAYAIYFWVANNITYDVKSWQAYLGGNESLRTEARTVLQDRSSVSSGYANLYKVLAMKVSLEVEVINGSAKSWRQLSQDPDAEFAPSRLNVHSWNVVKLGGVWFPLDCTFGSGSLDPSMHFNRAYSQDYFAARPEKWILTHWPLSVTWQLLQMPLTLEEVQPLIPVSIPTFALGVEPQMWSECICIPKGRADPTVKVNLKAINSDLFFSAKLVECEKSGNLQQNAAEASGFERAIFIEVSGDDVTVRAVMPHRGSYTLNVYMHSISRESQQEYPLCLSYQIQCEIDPCSYVGYPMTYWTASAAFNFELLHWNIPKKAYISENTDGRVDIVFKAQPGLRFDHSLISGKSDGLNSSASDSHKHKSIIVCDPNNPSLYMLRAVFPCGGWWTVYLCATNSKVSHSNGTSGFTALLNYHIFAKVGSQDLFYPHLLSPDVHLLSAEPISASGSDILVVPFSSPEIFDFHCYLTYKQLAGANIEECAQVESLDSPFVEMPSCHMYQLKVIFPKPGRWFIHVFAKDKSSPTEKSFAGLFNICVDVEGAMKNCSFPYLNPTVAGSLNIKLLSSDHVTFADDGKPFIFQFLAPQAVDLLHSLESDCENGSSTQNHSSQNNVFLQHCTFLSSEASGDPSTYTLRAVFPCAGKWAVRLFASMPNSSNYELAIQLTFNVSNPTSGVGYPVVLPAFQQLGLSIPDENLIYRTCCDGSQFELPFNAPEHVHFAWNMQLLSESESYNHQAFVHYMQDHSPNRILHMAFPRSGKWVLHLLAKPTSSSTESNNYCPVLELRIGTNAFSDHLSFPQIFEPFRTTFDMKIEKSTLPLISKVHKLPSSLTIPFYSPPSVKFWHDANVANKGVHSVTRMISNPETGLHELVVEFTEVGCWTISLYAQNIESSSKSWTAVLQHIVIAELDKSVCVQ